MLRAGSGREERRVSRLSAGAGGHGGGSGAGGRLSRDASIPSMLRDAGHARPRAAYVPTYPSGTWIFTW